MEKFNETQEEVKNLKTQINTREKSLKESQVNHSSNITQEKFQVSCEKENLLLFANSPVSSGNSRKIKGKAEIEIISHF